MGSLVRLELVSGSFTLDISDVQNFLWQGHAGFGLANLHRIALRGSQQHGETDMGFLLDPRTIMLSVRIMGTSLDDLYSKQSQLLGMVVPNATLSLRFTRIGASVVRQIDVKAVGGLDFASANRHGYTVVEQITLRASDPTWYDPTAAALGFSMGGSTPTTGTGGSSAAAAVYTPTIGGTIYYVDKANGNDNYNGLSTAAPFKTLTKAAGVLTAGTTLYIRGNTYNERLVVAASGAAGSYINVLAYPGETVVIDGTGGLGMGLYSALVNIYGGYIYVANLEVRNSVGMGIFLNGVNCVAHGNYVHHAQSNGILGGGDGSIIEFNQVWRTCLMNEFGKSSTWPSACSTAREAGDLITDNGIIRSNIVWENWGEGISTYQATGTIIEDNIVHDSYSANLYVSDSTGVTVRRNFVYANVAGDPYMYTGLVVQGSNAGIMGGSELQAPSLANITIVDNVVYGCNRDYYWWINAVGDHMIGYTIANNVFANGPNYAVQIAQAAHTTSVFQNNIVIQDDAAQPIVLLSTNITYGNNIWSKALPSGTGSAAGDVVGDPKLNRQGSPFTSPWSSDYYKPQASSPAINAGLTIAAAALDYYRVTRTGTTDIGPVEFVTASLPNALTVPMVIPFSVGASSINISQTAAYPGTADSYPWITLTGPITSPVITLSDGTVTLTLNFAGITIAAGDVRIIDCRWPYKTIVDASGANKAADITDDSVLALFALKAVLPGESVHNNTFTVIGSNANPTTRADVNWYIRFIGN